MPEKMIAGDERALLENLLDRNRAALIDTARGLSESDARRRLVASLTTPISLIKHVAAAERFWFQRFLAGLDESEWDGHATPGDGSFMVESDETLSDVIAQFERAIARSRDIAARYDLDDTKLSPQGEPASVRYIYLHLIEHHARHAGHGDILREMIG